MRLTLLLSIEILFKSVFENGIITKINQIIKNQLSHKAT